MNKLKCINGVGKIQKAGYYGVIAGDVRGAAARYVNVWRWETVRIVDRRRYLVPQKRISSVMVDER